MNKEIQVKGDKNGHVSKSNFNIQLAQEKNVDLAKSDKFAKLDEDQVNYIIQSSSAFISNFTQSSELKVPYSTIIYNQNKYKKEIKRARELWLSRLSNEPFTHKRVRLQQYQTLYSNMIAAYDGCKSVKEQVMVSKHLESLLDKSRLEIEGNKVSIKHNISVSYDDNTLLEESKNIIDLVEYEEID